MYQLRRSDDRGKADHGWLKSHHTFSFAEYYDTAFMGFRALRVINEDHVAAGGGFPTHPHRDMEILTYMVSGELEHRDTLGNGALIRRGELQYMSAGTGIRHSEFNPHAQEIAHLLQIWVMPDREGHPPAYGQKSFLSQLEAGQLTLLASQGGRGESLKVHQDMSLWGGWMAPGNVVLPLESDRYGWLQMVKGRARFGGEILHAGDAMAVGAEEAPVLALLEDCEFLFFDLA